MKRKLISFRQLQNLCGYQVPRPTCNDTLCNRNRCWLHCDKQNCPVWKSLKQINPVCTCDLRSKLVGDGCEVCNPEYAVKFIKKLKQEGK